ncbi:MAG: hypothetical protein PHH13_02140 [Candidatus Peribacteraceae bacterium]|nr:hypothetical protein [Candidatus Peribacteraceae bacterium]
MESTAALVALAILATCFLLYLPGFALMEEMLRRPHQSTLDFERTMKRSLTITLVLMALVCSAPTCVLVFAGW